MRTPVASAFRRKIVLRKIVLLMIVACTVGARAEIIDRIMAVVAGQPVTLSDVSAALLFRLVEPPPGTPDPLAYGLERLIDRTVMLAEVDRYQPPEPDAGEIASRVAALEQRAGSAAAFEKALAVTGMTREQLQRHIRDDLRTTTYLNQRFGANTAPAERADAIAGWIAELRRRAEITVPYRAR